MTAGRVLRVGRGGGRAVGHDDLHPYRARSATTLLRTGTAACTTGLNAGALRVVSARLGRGPHVRAGRAAEAAPNAAAGPRWAPSRPLLVPGARACRLVRLSERLACMP
ncbi:hypothetical protein T492DRAFT_894995 [Pavlovales sp. CCMP2436]|nr:hypothetical protein T492DRAFT_894995 [Pavlovales sp. CCMP2436]